MSQPCLKAESLITDAKRIQKGHRVKILAFKSCLNCDSATEVCPHEQKNHSCAVISLLSSSEAGLSSPWELGFAGHGRGYGHGYGQGQTKQWACAAQLTEIGLSRLHIFPLWTSSQQVPVCIQIPTCSLCLA